MIDGVESQLDASRDTESIKDAKEVVSHGMLAEAEFARDLPVGEPFFYQPDYVLLALCEEAGPVRVQNSKRRMLRQSSEHLQELRTVGPDLAGMDLLHTFAERLKPGVRERKHTSRARAKGGFDQMFFRFIEEEYCLNCGKGLLDLLQ